MSNNNQIDLVEFSVKNSQQLKKVQTFFSNVFDWKYKEWGETYSDTSDSGLMSGINSAEGESVMTLAVIYTKDLEATKEKIIAEGGVIIRDTYTFPGGRRFHFIDPAGNQLAVWSE